MSGAPQCAVPRRVFFWYDTTARQPFETGIQRVTRRLGRALAAAGVDVVPVAFDWRRRCIRTLPIAPGVPAAPAALLEADAEAWMLVTEVPIAMVEQGLDPLQIGRAYGLRTAALVHDLIPVKLADLYPAHTRQVFARYYQMFAEADLAFATTRMIADELRAHLALGGPRVPDMSVVPLPAQLAEIERRLDAPPVRDIDSRLKLLTVGTWEPRKNLPRLLRALRAVTGTCPPIELTIVGRRSGFPAYEAEVEALLRDLPNARVVGRLDDHALAACYADAHASIYPSSEEGFGLPVVESLWLARGCVCHEGSAMAEVAPGGGTLMIDMMDEDRIAATLVELATRPELVQRLAEEAIARPLRTWANLADDVVEHLDRVALTSPRR